ncbi:nitronate monooxygenase family protein [Gulosibacter sp. 10]|uniref:NAD(P)H-dependent flavin oxidoreductase n=1 Tax=Gulosibacter sp. 10 TaxID=1255570 RepID=UPI00097F1054|nr:nitronate monooxygenase [Gulosibacter sp. 10]SJM53757.1 Enoyl-[acyl-carrier-protein] reductase [FMN] [Gulosibacter sp. 10]
MTRNRPLGALPVPILAAPMAGGPSTPELVIAVAEAGGFGFLAGGYATVDSLAEQVGRVRARTDRFGVNLFVPNRRPMDADTFRAYAEALVPEAEALGVGIDPEPVDDDDLWTAKLEWLLDHPVPVVSLTFGLPDAAEVAALHAVGTAVLASVTTPEEGRSAAELGVDGLVVQGPGAGGHSAGHDPRRLPSPVDGAELVRRVVDGVGLPVIAAGGVDGPGAIRALLDAGAEAVAIGTLLLRSEEAGTAPAHRRALADPRFEETVVTHCFTGRPARALRNGFIERHGAQAPFAYPAVHHLTRPIRRAAAAAEDPERLHLWAGTGYRSAEERPAGEIVRDLAAALRRG